MRTSFLLLASCLLSSRRLSVNAQSSSIPSCPNSLDDFALIDQSAVLYYALVPSNPAGSANGIFCARLEYDGEAWVSIAIPQDAGSMIGSEAIIGLPDSNTVLKYDLNGKSASMVNPMAEERQTLKDTSIVQEGGKTIMSFTKMLVEAGELEIVENGIANFLYAGGSGNTLGYHSARMGFELDFSTVEVGATDAPTQAGATDATTQADATDAPTQAGATDAPTQAGATDATTQAGATDAPTQAVVVVPSGKNEGTNSDVPAASNSATFEPTVAPSAVVSLQSKDCSKEFCDNELASDYLQRYRINIPDGTNIEECAGCTISMELIYDGEAWVSIGFSENGMMIGSEAVIGIPGSVPEKYTLGGFVPTAVAPMAQDKQTLTDASVEFTNGQTIMKFTKIMKEPDEIEITTGDNNFLWAHGSSTTLAYHSARAPFVLNLSSGISEETAIPNKGKWLAHGIIAFFSWAVFVPFAVQSALLRPLFPEGPIWFHLHRAFNTFALVLFIVLFAIAVATSSEEGGGHFTNSHEKMGLAMFIMAIAQVVGGALRPHTPASGEEKTQVRKGWEVGHRLLGTSLLACGFWQMQEGIKLYGIKYSIEESQEDKVIIAYWVWVGLMVAVMVIGGGFYKLKRKNSSDTD